MILLPVPGSTLDASFKLLYESEEKLKNIVQSKFDAAVHSQDVASVERFFKIFPLLAMHTEGITKFSKCLAAQVGFDNNPDKVFVMHTTTKKIFFLCVSGKTILNTRACAFTFCHIKLALFMCLDLILECY